MAQTNPKIHPFEVAKHNTDKDAWIILDGKVYDITDFTLHPGSHAVLLRNAGTDRTARFHEVGHPSSATETMKKFYVGDLSDTQQDVERQAVYTKILLGAFVVLGAYMMAKKKCN